jgi:5,10-methylenetetrahydromethanopterin reductase
MVDISCAFATSPDTPEHVEIAERLGYRTAWLYDTPALCTDVWIALALAAQRTSSIGLGTGVLVPRLRHVLVTAVAAAQIELLALVGSCSASGPGSPGVAPSDRRR